MLTVRAKWLKRLRRKRIRMSQGKTASPVSFIPPEVSSEFIGGIALPYRLATLHGLQFRHSSGSSWRPLPIAPSAESATTSCELRADDRLFRQNSKIGFCPDRRTIRPE